MPLAVDHVFICVENPHAAERALADFGLQFGRRRIHQGQGTANACAFFDNAYLELLWRHDDDDLQSEVVRPLGLWERVRWRETGASPFGVAFRPENVACVQVGSQQKLYGFRAWQLRKETQTFAD